MRAFSDDQKWASQSFVAVADGGQDPCDLRLSGGDQAVRMLIEDAVPMFEFAVRTTIARFDLRSAEGRVQGLRAAAPIVANIRDRALRPEYTRTVAGWIGVEVEQVLGALTLHDGGQRLFPRDLVAPAREESVSVKRQKRKERAYALPRQRVGAQATTPDEGRLGLVVGTRERREIADELVKQRRRDSSEGNGDRRACGQHNGL